MAKDNNKKTKKVGRIAGTISELKQVSWPSFATTMKRLGAVLVVTLFFLVILTGIDAGLGFIHRELFQLATNDTIYLRIGQIVALIVAGVLVVGAIVGVIIYKVVKSRNKKDL